ncbi:hypothetical protein [Pantoea agglomerans]|uniref:hypothetical protein n=1 Tax=Enterobacter agglomerans TaxID=549 RepID=UPI0027822089|nr:hypothetical protein [Pantoea agglomerans]MDQ0628036.1 hypothetical protein [Pantoea agglomerans]
MKKLIPGGMAVIVGSSSEAFTNNVGRLVRTVCREGMLKSKVTGMVSDCWFIEVPDGAKPLKGKMPDGRVSMSYCGNIPAALLMPLDSNDPDADLNASPVYGSMGKL